MATGVLGIHPPGRRHFWNSLSHRSPKNPPLLKPRHVTLPRAKPNGGGGIENSELIIGDVLMLTVFATYKQIISLVTAPTFQGYLAPLHFNLLRFEEFFGFLITLVGVWCTAGLFFGAYSTASVASVRAALLSTSRTWIVSMSIAASQLALSVSSENSALVGTEGWGHHLPLAASGTGEPFVTAAQLMMMMAVWRTFYSTHLDYSKFLGGARLDQEVEAQHFRESLVATGGLALVFFVALHLLTSTSSTMDPMVIIDTATTGLM